jgi:hypothetical protein
MAMQQKQKAAATKNQTPWGARNTRTPAGLNTTAQLVRFQNYMAAKNAMNMGPPKPPQQQAATPPVTPAAQPRGTGKKRGLRMPGAGQYRSGVTGGQPHPIRNKGAAQTAQTAQAAATPPPSPAPAKKSPKDVLAEVQSKIRSTAKAIRKHEDRWDTTKGYEGFSAQQLSKLKMLIGVARKAQKDMRPENAAELAAAGASRTAELVSRARANSGSVKQMRQASLLPEETQPRGRGKRGKDKQERKKRGQAGN